MTAVLGYFRDVSTGMSFTLPTSPSVSLGLKFDRTELLDHTSDSGKLKGTLNLFDLGGGTLTIGVSGVCERYNAGDAEWYMYQLLTTCLNSGLGYLGVNQYEYPNCWFIQGKAEVFYADPVPKVTYDLQFQSTLPFNPPWDPAITPGSVPIEYPGRSEGGIFLFNGIQLGAYSRISTMDVKRPSIQIKIPRAKGIRHRQKIDGAEISINVPTWIHNEPGPGITRGSLELEVAQKIYQIGGGVHDLSGNGNIFTNFHLDDYSPQLEEDNWWTCAIDFKFISAYNN